MIRNVRRVKTNSTWELPIHFSLRELLVIVFVAALGLASLRAGGLMASLAILIGIVFSMGIAIVAFIGIAQLRAFAIGFLVPLVVYGVIVYIAGPKEMDPFDGRLPTTQLLRYGHEVLVTRTWTDSSTGKVVPDDKLANYQNQGFGGGGFAGPSVILHENPDRITFMTLGHGLIGMLFGWVGGKFGGFVYRLQHKSSIQTSARS